MLKNEFDEIKDSAKLIVSGYAFLPREDGFIGILNLDIILIYFKLFSPFIRMK